MVLEDCERTLTISPMYAPFKRLPEPLLEVSPSVPIQSQQHLAENHAYAERGYDVMGHHLRLEQWLCSVALCIEGVSSNKGSRI